MERNRRIGKAYARVPIVTIDGSHELSYDGYKLALNGFDNPDRDLRTEECRKRIGKGIRIKMDNFGNILIKRLSKSGVYIKDWCQAPASLPSSGAASQPPGEQNFSSATSGSTTMSMSAGATAGAADNRRLMPSRQQLIRNQNAATLNGSTSSTSTSLDSANSMDEQRQQPGGSLMITGNDSAICDQVLSVGGRLDQDKIYVLFDMKKFQANITQELCRPYPDKRKLEQQCFSIIGLTRDSRDILDLPCWVMVINIVAIEVLNERFPDSMMGHNHRAAIGYAPAGLRSGGGGGASGRQPPFVSIFDGPRKERGPSKEEDPYSLPANESSSDMKSSIHGGEYAGAGPKARHPNPSKSRAQVYRRGMSANDSQQQQQQQNFDGQPMERPAPLRHKSRSNSNIYGVGLAGKQQQQQQQQQRGAHLSGSRMYNNSSSIYSPGHMLVLPSNDSVPPELPPRDFVSKKVTKSKSSSAISVANNQPDEIYSTGLLAGQPLSSTNTKVRKTKRNRFLESLKAPLELAKSSSHSVLGSSSSSSSTSQSQQAGKSDSAAAKSQSSKKGTRTQPVTNKGGSSNIVKSFLGVGNKQKQQQQQLDDDRDKTKTSNGKSQANRSTDSAEVDSVVDSSEELADEPLSHDTTNDRTPSASSSSYNDLDIPTPDYETDENIYALNNETASYAAFSSIGGINRKSSDGSAKKSTTTTTSKKNNQSTDIAGGQQQKNATTTSGNNSNNNNNKNGKQNNGSKKAHNKDDLYYSGFRAHVPSNINGSPQVTCAAAAKAASLMDGPIGDANGRLTKARSSRYASHHMAAGKVALNQQSGKMSGRDMMIYGSTTGLSAAGGGGGCNAVGSRYRSASMQRYYSRSQQPPQAAALMYSDYYDQAGPENTYGGSHYGVPVQNRRRSNGKCLPLSGSGLYAGNCLTSTNPAGNYDIGRSSSGIYGLNSNSSSSSDYADWHPQMRKVNSSGYLNSIFKSHHHQGSPVESPYGMAATGQTGVAVQKSRRTGHASSGNNGRNGQSAADDGQGFVGSPRTLAPALSKQHQQHLKQQSHGQMILPNGGQAYRSYESSNDSYTNSSDGLDIYDHIGAAQVTTTRPSNNGKLHHKSNNNNNNHHLHHRQFLDMQPIHAPVAHNHLAPEVHVGEWENMYDR